MEERFWDKRVKSIDKDADRFSHINVKVLEQTKTFLNERDIVLNSVAELEQKPVIWQNTKKIFKP